MPPAPEPPEGPARLVCRRLGVSSLRIAEAIRAHGLDDIPGLKRVTSAGTGCATCHPELEEILGGLRGEPIPEAQRLVNRRTNRIESERRIEGALELWVVPRLLEGSAVELVSVDGLRVELHLISCDHLRVWIAETLRKHVCDDLEVVFG